jgi:hypothetical protein
VKSAIRIVLLDIHELNPDCNAKVWLHAISAGFDRLETPCSGASLRVNFLEIWIIAWQINALLFWVHSLSESQTQYHIIQIPEADRARPCLLEEINKKDHTILEQSPGNHFYIEC